jgi:mono/diheme cytochrome c family protein
MKPHALIAVSIAVLFLAACNSSPAPQQDVAKGPASGVPPGGGPPPPPPYQTRAELPGGDRLAGGKNGEALFSNRCGACHLAGGMGTNLLTKQRMMAGEPPESAMLANRKDLTIAYVKTVVRQGKMAMPRLSRAEVTDAELDAIARYLGKAGE